MVQDGGIMIEVGILKWNNVRFSESKLLCRVSMQNVKAVSMRDLQ